MAPRHYDDAPGVVLFKDTAELSMHGCFEDDAENNQVWGEEQVRDFIRRSRPDLFKSLNELPIATDHVAEPVELGYEHLTPTESALMLQVAIIASQDREDRPEPTLSEAKQRPQMRMYQKRTTELQHMRNIEQYVIGGQPLVLRKLQRPGNLLMCSAPACQHAIGHGAYFISVLGDREIHYGLECLESLFADRKRAIRRAKALFSYTALDGAADNEFVMPHNLPSNSLESRLLRHAKQHEIDAIVEEDILFQAQQHHALISPVQEGEVLQLRRPPGLEPLRERYKKQGLTNYDQASARKLHEHTPKESTSTDVNLYPADDGAHLICYCRELEGEGELIQCNNYWCLIGWFHVECCNEQTPILTDEPFYCGFCADLTRPPPDIDDESDEGWEDNGASFDDMDEEYWNGYEAEHESGTNIDGGNYEMSDTPVDESPRTPSPTPWGEIQRFSPPYMGTPTGFVTVNPRPNVAQSESSLIAGLDGVFEPKERHVKKIYSKADRNDENTSQIKFEDLAPFIIYKTSRSITGLTDSDILRFEGWKYCMPNSKLLPKEEHDIAGATDRFSEFTRHDIQAMAQQWIDRTVRKGRRNVFKSLSKWLKIQYPSAR